MATNAIDAQGWLVQAEADKVALDYINQVVLANCASSSGRTTFLTAISGAITQLNAMEVAVELFLGNTVTFPSYTAGTTLLFTGVVPVWTGSVTYGDDRGLLTAAADSLAAILSRYTLWVNYLIMANDGSGHTYGGTTAKSSNYTTAQTTLLSDLAGQGAAVLVL